MENIDNTVFFNIYKDLFKEQGIKLKSMDRKQHPEFSDIVFNFLHNVSYGVRWYSNQNFIIYGRINRKQVPAEPEDEKTLGFIETHTIKDPDAEKVVKIISKDYITYLKKQGFIKRIISKIIKENIEQD